MSLLINSSTSNTGCVCVCVCVCAYAMRGISYKLVKCINNIADVQKHSLDLPNYAA